MVENCRIKDLLNNNVPINIDCTPTAMTAERAYYRCGNFFIKRSLRPSEYKTTQRGTKHIPRLGKERLQNEAATLHYIRRVSNIPVPTLYGAFMVDESFILVTEYIDGVAMSNLAEDQKRVVCTKVEQYRATLRGIKSNTIGGPSGIVLPPYRVMRLSDRNEWPRKVTKDDGYIFCHNDLAQHNIIVDPETLEIRAIIDWEYAGFFPEYFEWPFYKRRGPSVAQSGEDDDSAVLLEFLETTYVDT
ncbi:kinase-like domain-containing protein [Aspergillus filifer]